MSPTRRLLLGVSGAALLIGLGEIARPADPPQPNQPPPRVAPPGNRPADAVQDFQTPQPAPGDRPEQKKNDHDQGTNFTADGAPPSSTAFETQPDKGRVTGFDFYRDPLN